MFGVELNLNAVRQTACETAALHCNDGLLKASSRMFTLFGSDPEKR